MAQTSLEHALSVVESLGLTRFQAWDHEGNTLEHHECESKEDLAQCLTECVRNNSGLLRVDAWQTPPERKVGQRKADVPKVERLSWRIRGLLGQPQPQPVPQPITGHRSDPVVIHPQMPVEVAVEHARLAWRVEYLTDKLKELEQDEQAEQDEPEQAAPVGGGGLFGMTGEQTFQVLSGLKELIPGLIPRAAQSVSGLPPVGAPAMNAQERQVWEAFKRFQAANPDIAKDIIATVMDGYGPNAKQPEPPSHESE